MRTPRPTYAGVTSTLALFTALGGSAFAAATRWRAVGANHDNNDPQTMNVHVLCASP